MAVGVPPAPATSAIATAIIFAVAVSVPVACTRSDPVDDGGAGTDPGPGTDAAGGIGRRDARGGDECGDGQEDRARSALGIGGGRGGALRVIAAAAPTVTVAFDPMNASRLPVMVAVELLPAPATAPTEPTLV